MTALAIAHLTPADQIDGWVAGCATCERRSVLVATEALAQVIADDHNAAHHDPTHTKETR